MVRTQLQLPEDLSALVKRIARQQKRSIAAIIRDSIRLYASRQMHEPEPSREEMIQRFMESGSKWRSGKSDISERHDDYLAETYAQ